MMQAIRNPANRAQPRLARARPTLRTRNWLPMRSAWMRRRGAIRPKSLAATMAEAPAREDVAADKLAAETPSAEAPAAETPADASAAEAPAAPAAAAEIEVWRPAAQASASGTAPRRAWPGARTWAGGSRSGPPCQSPWPCGLSCARARRSRGAAADPARAERQNRPRPERNAIDRTDGPRPVRTEAEAQRPTAPGVLSRPGMARPSALRATTRATGRPAPATGVDRGPTSARRGPPGPRARPRGPTVNRIRIRPSPSWPRSRRSWRASASREQARPMTGS